MKHTYLSFLFALVCIAPACKFKPRGGSNTTFKVSEKNGIVTKSATIENDTLSLFVEYAGNVSFNADHTNITSISPKGYLKYRRNDSELSAENEDGMVQFELSEHGRKIDSETGKSKLIKSAYDAIRYTEALRLQKK